MIRTAFTLVEMLAALALSAALMVAVLSLSTGVSRTERAMAATHQRSDTHEALVELLRRDLSEARQVDILSQGIRLIGPLQVEPDTQERSHLPVEVRYEIAESPVGGLSGGPAGGPGGPGGTAGSILLRCQRRLEQRTNQAESRRLVATGVRSIQFTPVASADSATDQADVNVMPAAIRIQVIWNDESVPMLSRLLVME